MTQLIGHFHPLLVHLPIGILILALLISLLPEDKRIGMQTAFTLSLAVAAITSALACASGYLLSDSGDYDTDLVRNHQWAGIATSALCFAAWLAPRFNRQILWCTVITLTIASHMGGTLTHGEGYLLPSEQELPLVADSTFIASDTIAQLVSDTGSTTQIAKQVFIYRDEITPILKNKCYNCHSAVKKKGGLRLDKESFIHKGGKNGEILVKGDPNSSPLYTNLLLPLEDEKHMPPKGKKQLSGAEIAIIHRWISKGAPFGAVDISTTEPVMTSLALPVSLNEPNSTSSIPPATIKEQTSTLIPPAKETSIQSLQEKGIIVEKITPGSNQLSVNFVNVKELDASMIRSVNDMREQVTILKFTDQALTDQMLKELAKLNNLEILHLEKTSISDEGMTELKKFSNLESLNLYGTNITDTGLKELTGRNLKKLNVWNTRVTENGIKTLLLKNPDLKVETGQLSLKKVDSIRKN